MLYSPVVWSCLWYQTSVPRRNVQAVHVWDYLRAQGLSLIHIQMCIRDRYIGRPTNILKKICYRLLKSLKLKQNFHGLICQKREQFLTYCVNNLQVIVIVLFCNTLWLQKHLQPSPESINLHGYVEIKHVITKKLWSWSQKNYIQYIKQNVQKSRTIISFHFIKVKILFPKSES